MSAIGTKRTKPLHRSLSAIGVTADIRFILIALKRCDRDRPRPYGLKYRREPAYAFDQKRHTRSKAMISNIIVSWLTQLLLKVFYC